MKNDKICISKAVALFVPVALFLIAVVLLSGYVLNSPKKSSSNVRASGSEYASHLVQCSDANGVKVPYGYCSPNDGQYMCNYGEKLSDGSINPVGQFIYDGDGKCFPKPLASYSDAQKAKTITMRCIAGSVFNSFKEMSSDAPGYTSVKPFYAGRVSCDDTTKAIFSVRAREKCSYGGVELTIDSTPYAVADADIGCILDQNNRKVGLRCDKDTAFENEPDDTKCKAEAGAILAPGGAAAAAAPAASGAGGVQPAATAATGCAFGGDTLRRDGKDLVLGTQTFKVTTGGGAQCILYKQLGITDKISGNDKGFIHWHTYLDNTNPDYANPVGGYVCSPDGSIKLDKDNCKVENLLDVILNP